MKRTITTTALIALAFSLGGCATPSGSEPLSGVADRLTYPELDPPSLVEQPDDPRTGDWIRAQHAATRERLDPALRESSQQELAGIRAGWSMRDVEERGGTIVYRLVETGSGAAKWYARRSGEDPVLLFGEGSVGSVSLSPDGESLVWTPGGNGLTLRVRNLGTGADHPDQIEGAVSVTWSRDSRSFYYTRRADGETVASVWHHRVGQPQSDDAKVWDGPLEPGTEIVHDISSDGRWLLITNRRPEDGRSEIWYVDLRAPMTMRPVRPLVTGYTGRYDVVDVVRGQLLMRTDNGAARGRIVAAPLGRRGPAITRQALAEIDLPLVDAHRAAESLVLHYLDGGASVLRVVDLDGGPNRSITLPGPGRVGPLRGEPGDRMIYFSWESPLQRPGDYRADVVTTTIEPLGAGATSDVAIEVASGPREGVVEVRSGERNGRFYVHAEDPLRWEAMRHALLLRGWTLVSTLDPSVSLREAAAAVDDSASSVVIDATGSEAAALAGHAAGSAQILRMPLLGDRSELPESAAVPTFVTSSLQEPDDGLKLTRSMQTGVRHDAPVLLRVSAGNADGDDLAADLLAFMLRFGN